MDVLARMLHLAVAVPVLLVCAGLAMAATGIGLLPEDYRAVDRLYEGASWALGFASNVRVVPAMVTFSTAKGE